MNSFHFKKGYNLKIKGSANKVLLPSSSSTYAICPDDFFALTPKLVVKEGDKVKVGQTIFYNKQDERIKFASPVSGSITSILRGEKRKVLKIVITDDGKNTAIDNELPNVSKASVEDIKKSILDSGCWGFIKQRPYGIIASPDDTPKAIYISTYSNSPLNVDFDFILKKNQQEFQKGIDVLSKLTKGKVYLGVEKNFKSSYFRDLDNVEIYEVKGLYPSENLSFHIEKISPINKDSEKVWTINPEDVVNIGHLFTTGKYIAQRTVAVAGPNVKNPSYCTAKIGADVKGIIESISFDCDTSTLRFISGNVYTGNKVCREEGHVNFYHNTLTVIPEGNDYRLLGWLPFVGNKIPSASRLSLAKLLTKKTINTNLNGEERALVVTGEMEKVFPMNIYVMQLIKACLSNDIDKMEELGIYEVVPEDFGIIDFVNTSKIEAQEIIKQGIELMIKEVG